MKVKSQPNFMLLAVTITIGTLMFSNIFNILASPVIHFASDLVMTQSTYVWGYADSTAPIGELLQTRSRERAFELDETDPKYIPKDGGRYGEYMFQDAIFYTSINILCILAVAISIFAKYPRRVNLSLSVIILSVTPIFFLVIGYFFGGGLNPLQWISLFTNIVIPMIGELILPCLVGGIVQGLIIIAGWAVYNIISKHSKNKK
ncbi:hypothetical protein JW962_00490 [Candidatus Dojkabacteria bacterium]|nr:hypothetical protein [Candidatus Dojkabacteria bacterium]